MDRTPLPLTFRYHLVAQLMRLIQAGESAAMVGVASVGKSNLVRCLQQPDIQAAHLGADKSEILIILVDSNDLAAMTEWNFLELLLYRLSFHGQSANLPAEVVTRLEEWHEKAARRTNDTLNAQRCLEQALHWLCQVKGLRVVFLLDEFELIYPQLSQRTWANLRALRDKNKYSLSYLLFLRRDLEDMLPVTPEVEAFAELFQTHILGLKPYDLPGTELMLERLSLRQRVEWPVQYTSRVFDLSGGHGGLIRVIFGKMLPALKEDQQPDWSTLFNDAEVRDECGKIWSSLTTPERAWLAEFVETDKWATEPGGGVIIDKLTRKGLIVAKPVQEPHLFSTLFAAFVRQTTAQNRPSFQFDAQQQLCWIEGRQIHLPGLPAQLLDFLYQHQGQNCRRLDLLRHLYPEEDHRQLGKIPDFRLDAVVKSLREKIEPNPQTPRYIKTVRGVGFRLDIDE
ncbi:MAG: winged helix-turn-helix domain-containing protein [Anaerolineae bacterium]|nr:winged helix-turn-helix domain-containing protein [Anaerolineae bacterium]